MGKTHFYSLRFELLLSMNNTKGVGEKCGRRIVPGALGGKRVEEERKSIKFHESVSLSLN